MCDRCIDLTCQSQGFSGNDPVKSGLQFQLDIPLKPAAGLTRPNTDFRQFSKTAVLEAQNKRLLGQDSPRVWIDAV